MAHTIAELDELQHFSSYRLASLSFYENLSHQLDRETYRSLCHLYQTRAGKAFAHRVTKDFPLRGGRTAHRAYMDAVRDLLAPTFGLRVVRIPSPDYNVRAAVETLWIDAKS